VAPQAGIEITEQVLTTDDLSSADEVFIGSTTREVAPVGFVSPRWNYAAPGKVTTALEVAFQNYVERYLRAATLKQ
jgi:branched-subunit amino acid aminotransferase/4-amino-4-deoxychorismate lyase